MRVPTRWCAVLLLVASAASALAQGNATDPGPNATPAAAPRLVLGEVTHDFGQLKAGVPLRWAFKIGNAGDGDLLIKGVKPG